MNEIKFNIPLVLGDELSYIQQVCDSKKISGEHGFSNKCSEWFNSQLNCPLSIPTPSCTSALELALLLIDLKPGDEVILPSFTFTSTATAILQHNAVPVFVDSLNSNLNIDPESIVKAINNKTRAIIPVHYAGISCDMETIMGIAKDHNLHVIEDAAQCTYAFENDKHIGYRGDFSTFSFHETKNIHCGNGGMLCINNEKFIDKAEIARDKGSNRQKFLNGQIDKYSWVDKGSSYFMSDLQAAFLIAQLEKSGLVTEKRLKIWNHYHNTLKEISEEGHFAIPKNTKGHNAHIFYLKLKSNEGLKKLQTHLKKSHIQAVTHYVPLHTSKAGVTYGTTPFPLDNCNNFHDKILRLPLHLELSEEDINHITNEIKLYFKTDK